MPCAVCIVVFVSIGVEDPNFIGLGVTVAIIPACTNPFSGPPFWFG